MSIKIPFHKRGILICISFIFIFSSVSGQQLQPTTSDNGEILAFKVSSGHVLSELESLLRQGTDWNNQFGIASKGELLIDKLGQSHQRYDQTFMGHKIFGATLVAHLNQDEIKMVSGRLTHYNSANGDNQPALGEEIALQNALDHVGAQAYMWESEETETFLKNEQEDEQATFFPSGELIYYPMNLPSLVGELRLAYVFDIYASQPLSRQEVFVDALNGSILFVQEKIHHIDEMGTAQTAYYGQKPITTYRPNTTSDFQLLDNSRGGGIETYNCFDTDNYTSAQIPTNTINDWDYSSLTERAILDAHYGTAETYDFFQALGWSSYDNQNSPMRSYVHFSLIDYGYSNNNNAFWDGSRMTYGDGDGVTYNPLTALDVVGHEICHGVTENSSDLIYSYESGALNESFSDIFGSCIEYEANPSGFSWLLGNDMSVSGSALRNLSDPNMFDHPDTYLGNHWLTGSFDNGGVHFNSGVQNFWFYLLSEGGSGVNDNGDSYFVPAIGIEDASEIAFRNLTVYLNSSSQYADARAFSIQSAIDLFGSCSDQEVAVTNAWQAVGVGDTFNNAVVANFTGSSNYACAIPTTIQFNNQSLNSSSFLWDFGDGSTSVELNPAHTYVTAGSYIVQLISNGATACNVTDTVYSTPILIEDGATLIDPICEPSTSTAGSVRIGNFQFGTISNPQESASTYEDRSCDFTTTVTEGTAVPLTVNLADLGNVAVYLDVNNDGNFSTSELIYNSAVEALNHNPTVIIPGVTVFDTSMRLRVLTSSLPIVSACSFDNSGQVIDYSARVLDNMMAPIALFDQSDFVLQPNEPLFLSDQSLNVPTNWEWVLPGTVSGNSTAQNPTVIYPAEGSYDISLIVSNSFGSDTLTLTNAINVITSFNLCEINESNAPNGTFFDPGGEGNYGDNDFCELLIAPSCAESITLSFVSFNTESCCDPLRVYDGSDANAPLLGTFVGSSLPPSVSSTGSEMFIVWDTDGSVISSGFEANWVSAIGSTEILIASAIADDSAPAFGQEVNFTDISIETPYSWFWDFGDGNASTDQNPTHSYLTSGIKTVTMTAVNCISSDTDTLLVDVQQPGGITINPTSISTSIINCNDSVNDIITITNTGMGDLTFSNAPNIITDDFESIDVDASLWESTTGVNSSSCGVHSGNSAFYFNSGSVRQATTIPLQMINGTEISFYLKYGTGSSPCESIDGGEGVVLEYSTNGIDFIVLEDFNIFSTYTDFAQITSVVSGISSPSMVQIRIRQLSDSGLGTDNWAIDDLIISGGGGANVVLNPDNGQIAPGDSLEINLTNYRNGRVAGTYNDQVTILTNATSAPSVVLPVELIISGDGILDVPTSCVTFPAIQENTSATDTVYLFNYGCADINIDNINVTGSGFSLSYTENVIIPQDSIEVLLNFIPSTFANFNEIVEVFYNGGNTSSFCLEGLALGAPTISTTPNFILLEGINCPDSIDTQIYIHNTGNGPLNWSFQYDVFEDFESGTLNPNFIESSTGIFSDVCGTYAGNSAQYFTNSGMRSIETVPFSANAQTDFSFFLMYGSGGSCNSVASNDYVRVDYSVNGGTWVEIVSVTDISNFYIWNQVSVTLPNEAFGDQTRLRIIQATTNSANFDVYAIDNMVLNGGLSAELSASPEMGTVLNNDSVLVTLSMDASQTDVGFYQETITILSDDPLQSNYEIPMDVIIGGDPEIVHNGPSCIDMGAHFIGNGSIDSVYIENIGCDVLNISNSSTSNFDFSIITSPSSIATDNGAWIYLDFSPSAVGLFSETLNINSNGGVLSICILGEGLETPAISVTPNVILLEGTNCPDVLETQIYVHNLGNGPLNWSFQYEVIEDFESGTLNTNFIESSTGEFANTCGAYEGNTAQYFTNSGTRYIETVPFTASSESIFSFYLLYGSGGLCNAIASNDYVRVEYSVNGGTWVEIVSVTDLTNYYSWNQVSVTLPIEAHSDQTRLRIIQATSNSANFDVYAIDNMSLTGGLSNEMTATPEMGTVLGNDSTLVTLSVDVSQTEVGFYQETITILSDDPIQSQYEVPMVMIIEGEPEITYSGPTCIDMGGHFIGNGSMDSVYVENTGCDVLNISNVTTTSNDFLVVAFPSTIEADNGAWIYLYFAPSSVGSFFEAINIFSNDSPLSICLIGAGVETPAISVTPNFVLLEGDSCPDIIESEIYVHNTGSGSLNWSFQYEVIEDFESGTLNTNFIESSTGEFANTCGTYEGNTAHYFTNSGTRYIETVPFTASSESIFSFYLLYGSGGSCNAVASNDYVRVDYSVNGGTWNEIVSVTDISNYYNWNQVSVTLPIGAFGNQTRLRIIQATTNSANFDVFAIDNMVLNGGLSTELSASPEMGTVLGNDSTLVTLSLDASQTDAGFYLETISILSNDPIQPLYEVPLVVIIDGEPEITHNGPTCIDMGGHFIGNGSIDSVYIENIGCDILNISNVTTSNNDFTVTASPTSIDSDNGEWIYLNFSPSAVGLLSETLNITSNAGLLTICLVGEGLDTPAISVTPYPILLTGTNCPDVVDTQFYILNTGNGPLNWSFQNELIEDFESGAINSNFIESSTGEFSNTCGTFEGNAAHYFTNEGTRSLETTPLIINEQSEFSFYLLYGSGGLCEAISNTDDFVRVDYSVNEGEWIEIVTVTDYDSYYTWNQFVVTLPNEAFGNQTRLRIIQGDSNNANTDIYAIDNVEFNGGLSVALTVSPELGTVPGNDSVLVTLSMDASEIAAGFYQETISIVSNDPINTFYAAPVEITIAGDPEVVYNGPACIDMGGHFLGNGSIDSVYIENIGCDILTISDVTTSNNDFTVTASPSSIDLDNGAWIYLSFSPSSVGLLSETLNITSNAVPLSICLIGEGLDTPALSVTPDPILLSGTNCPDVLETQFYIQNTGNGILNWSIQTDVIEDFESGTLNADFIESSAGEFSDLCGVYDGNFAHRFPNSGTRSIVTNPFTANAETIFSFYLLYGSGGDCETIGNGEHIRVEYSQNGGVWNEIISVTDISTYYSWNQVSVTLPAAAYGDQTRLRIVQASHDGTELDVFAIDNMMLNGGISANLILSPELGTVPGNDSVLVTLSMDVSEIGIGFYQETISIISNDPLQSEYTVPVEITIDGEPEIAYNGPTCIDMDAHFIGNGSIDSVYIENIGCDLLNISNVTTSNNDFTVTASPSSIDSDNGAWIYLSFSPSAVGLLSETLNITSNAGPLSICLIGGGLDTPAISVTPNPILLNGANCPDVVDTQFYILNTGNGPLNWSFQNDLIEDFESGTINSNFIESSTGVYANTCGTFEGNAAHYFTNEGTRSLETAPLNINEETEFSFYLLYGSGGLCEAISTTDDFVQVDYSVNEGEWVEIVTVTDYDNYYTWNQFVVTLPNEAFGNQTRLRIIQGDSNNANTDIYAIDNVAFNGGLSIALTASPDLGTVPGNDSVLVTLSMDASEIDAGFYQETISIVSNDPINTFYATPVEITIAGDPEIAYNGPTCIDMDAHFVGNGSIDSVYIENIGCDILNISNVTTSNSDFTVTASPSSIDSDIGAWIYLSFSPSTVGLLSETLDITTNAGPLSICLIGGGLDTPAISVTPNPILLNGTNCPDVLETQFYIQNTGNGVLNWSFQTEVIEDFESGTLNADFIESSAGVFSELCGVYAGNFAHRFANSGTRSIVTNPFTASAETIFSFYLLYGSGGDCEAIGGGEHIRVEYSQNGGVWNEIISVTDISFYQAWNQVSVTLPAAAYGDQTRLRIVQASHDGTELDVFAIDNMMLNGGIGANLIVSPELGTVPGIDSVLVTLSMDVSETGTGFYSETISIISNDPSQPEYTVPVEITIVDNKAILEQVWLGLNSPNLAGWNFSPGVELNDTWEGITMTADGCDILEINLPTRGLTGILAPELGSLTELYSLNFSNNSLSGSIPAELGNLSQLYELNLQINNLTGVIPSTFGAGMVGLNILYLSDNLLEGTLPAELGLVPNIASLKIGDNLLIGCYPATFTNHCDASVSASGSGLDNEDFSAFCASGLGGCQSLITLISKAYIQGPYNISTGLMNDNIRTHESFPLQSPYMGGFEEITDANILLISDDDAIVDWIHVELRDGNNPSNIIQAKSALLQKDGDIVSSTDGFSPLTFDNPFPIYSSLVVGIRHRNHLGIRNTTTISVTELSSTIQLDFTDLSLNILGGVDGAANVSGYRALFSGDGNSDGQINTFDLNIHWRPTNAVTFDYFFSYADFNMDGQVNSIDKNLHWRINNSRVSFLE